MEEKKDKKMMEKKKFSRFYPVSSLMVRFSSETHTHWVRYTPLVRAEARVRRWQDGLQFRRELI